MQDIWDDHHRRLREIDRKFKMRLKVLLIIFVIVFLAFAFVICKY